MSPIQEHHPAATEAVPLPTGIRRSTMYLPELEALRGIAMLLVYAYHVDGIVLYPTRFGVKETFFSPALGFVRAGHTGVNLFFILSGFLLSLPFIAEAGGGKRISPIQYFSRRALRILPLYYSAVIAATVLSANHLAELVNGLPYLLFLNSFAGWATPMNPYSNVWWSLATEVQFYLVLPLLPLVLRTPTGRRVGAVMLVTYAVAYGAFLNRTLGMTTVAGQSSLGHSLFGRAPLFLLGMFAAWIYQRAGDPIRERLSGSNWLRRGGSDVAMLAILVGMEILLRWMIPLGYNRAQTPPYHVWHVLEGVLWTGVLLLTLLAPLRTKWIFSNRPLRTLGMLSYSVYILHIPVVLLSMNALRASGIEGLVGWNVRTTALVAVLSGACLSLSVLTYRLIERPFLARKARLDR